MQAAGTNSRNIYVQTCKKILPIRYIHRWAEIYNPFLFKRFNEVEASIQRRIEKIGHVDMSIIVVDCQRLMAMLQQAVPYVDVPVPDEELQSDPEFDVPDLLDVHIEHGILQWSSEIEVDRGWLEPDDMPEEIPITPVQELNMFVRSP
jgi:hypothetical protein